MDVRRTRLIWIPVLLALVAVRVGLNRDWHRHYIDVNGVQREYLLYKPRNPESKELPLLLAFHGFSGTADRMRNSSLLHEMVDEHQFYLVYMEGDPTWHRPAEGRTCVDVEYFDAVCDALMQDYSIDSQRIYVTGMSMGGDFVIRLGGLRSQRIAAVASQAMLTRHAVEASRTFPLLVIVGTEDDRVPPAFFPRVPNEFEEQGHLVEVIRPEGVGHRWHIPLNEKLWQFLSTHRLE